MKNIVLSIVCLLSPLLAAAQFSGNGEGTKDDPYEITNAVELYQVRSNLTAAYKLMNDIDLTEWLEENSPNSGWTPFGAFNGTFDGDGHTVKYYVNTPKSEQVGLFSYTSRAVIKNLNVVGEISCKSGGGIIGRAYSSTITNCTFRGTVNASSTVGGIAGFAGAGHITDCIVSGKISGGGALSNVGGIVGNVNDTYTYIENCSFMGEVLGGGATGGIVGYTEKKSLYVNDCYFNGKISTDYEYGYVGGIIGNCYDGVDVRRCIVISPSIKGKRYVAGISFRSADIYSCIAVVDTLQYDDTMADGGGPYRISRTEKLSLREGTSDESLALSTMIIISENKTKPDKMEEGGYNGVGLGRAMLKMGTTYTAHNFDMSKVWTIEEGNGYPYLRNAADFISSHPGTPDGGNHSSYIISTDVSSLSDAIYAEATTALKGSEGMLTICLKNSQATNAYSFDLILPEGVTLGTDESGEYQYSLSERHNGHSASVNYNNETGVYSFAVLSLQSKEVKGSEGAIWTLKLNVADDVSSGEYVLKVQNAKYSLTSGAAKVSMANTTTKLTIEDYKKGDVNGDGDIDIADAVCIVNRVVGKETPAFVDAAADVNGDGEADIADAVRIVNLVVGKIVALSRQQVLDMREPQ